MTKTLLSKLLRVNIHAPLCVCTGVRIKASLSLGRLVCMHGMESCSDCSSILGVYTYVCFVVVHVAVHCAPPIRLKTRLSHVLHRACLRGTLRATTLAGFARFHDPCATRPGPGE